MNEEQNKIISDYFKEERRIRDVKDKEEYERVKIVFSELNSSVTGATNNG